MLWDMHLCVFDVRLSFENRVTKLVGKHKNVTSSKSYGSSSFFYAFRFPYEDSVNYQSPPTYLPKQFLVTFLVN